MLCDLTGPTSDVGKPICLGALDAVEWFEKNYPLPKGYKVDLVWVDFSYKVPEAQAAYNRFKALGVVAILGWGTGDTLALAPTVAQDKIPYLSHSYSAELLKKETPYNFFPQTDYSSQGRAMVMFTGEVEGDARRQPATSSEARPRLPERPLRHVTDTCDQGHG
jgi:branched-chain amino acid transport system substrate-binding protein